MQPGTTPDTQRPEPSGLAEPSGLPWRARPHDIGAVLRPTLLPVVAADTLDIVLRHLVDGVRDVVPEVLGAGVVAAVDDHELCRAATDDAVRDLLRGQLAAGDGPSLAAIEDRRVVDLPVRDAAAAWPTTRQQAAATGAEGLLVLPLEAGPLCLGSFTVLTAPPRLEPDARTTVDTLARAALLALERYHHQRHTQRALETRSLIGSAVGILMERYDLAEEAAWAFLRRRASTEERKLREVAADLVAGRGASPAAPRAPHG